MKYKNFIICALCLGATLPSIAITIEECKQMALTNNAKIKSAKNNIEVAKQTSKEAFTNYFPSISASGIGFNADKGTANMVLGPGMEMSMMKNGVMGSVSAVQPIFAGGQIVNGNKLSKVGIEVNRLQLEQSQNEVELTTEQYFWQIISLQEKRKTVLAVDSMLQSLCHDVEIAVNAGLTTRNDLLQVQLKRNEIESTRINLDNGIDVCNILLAQYIGIDDSSNISLSANIPTCQDTEMLGEIYSDPRQSLGATPEYRLLNENVKAQRLQQKIEVGKNMPSVGVGAGYVYHDILDNSRSFGAIFASLSVPISGWWGGSHAIKRQKLQVRNAELDLADKSELLIIKMKKAWIDLQDAHKQLCIANKSIEQSTENLRLNNEYYKAGTIKMSDLLDAQTLFQQSKDKYIDAYCTYKIKCEEYLQATGR